MIIVILVSVKGYCCIVDDDVEHVFMYLLDICVSPLEKDLFLFFVYI